jgi:hypothetical protein
VSEGYPTLAAALAAVQAKLPEIRKGETATVPTKAGGTFRYSYASLGDVSLAILPLLGAAGLCWMTRPTVNEAGRLTLAYELRHTSGESVSGEYPLSPGTPQEVGGQITYFRRYLLCAVTGVAPDGDDDDGAVASKVTTRDSFRDAWDSATPARTRQAPAAAAAPAATAGPPTGLAQRAAITRAAQEIDKGSDSAVDEYLEAKRIADVHVVIPGRTMSLHTLLARHVDDRIKDAQDEAGLRAVWEFAKRVDLLAAVVDGNGTFNDKIKLRRNALLAAATQPADAGSPATVEDAVAVLNAGGLTVTGTESP